MGVKNLAKKAGLVAENIGKYVENLTQDKDERAESCVAHLAKKEIKLCDTESKQEISQEQLFNTGIARFDDLFMIEEIKSFDESMTKYCLEEFAKHNIVQCNEISSKLSEELKIENIEPLTATLSKAETNNFTPPPVLTDETRIYQAINGKVDNILIPDDQYKNCISIGTTTKGASKKVIEGCNYIVRDFNKNDPDLINFSKFPELTYDDLYFTKISMNDKPTLAIHITDHQPHFFVCFYDLNESTLANDSFTFASPMHSEL